MTTERQEPRDGKSRSEGTQRIPAQTQPQEARSGQPTHRQPPTEPQPARPARPARSSPSREQLNALVVALGDPSHPLHPGAVDELVAFGSAAVPMLNEAMSPSQAWLSAYRAAEAAGRIGDGQATGALIQALNHPNSNVRWSAIHALTQIGDVRALLELRRVAQQDQGRTSWGESVAEAAQSALNELSRRSVWGQSIELIKTAVVAVLMIGALILAFSVTTTLRSELDRFGRFIPGQTQLPQLVLPTTPPEPTALAAETVPETLPEVIAAPTAEAVLAPTSPVAASEGITGTTIEDANVRPFPNTGNQPIGRVARGGTVIFIARSADSQWYLVRLGQAPATGTRINSLDGTGWINRALVTAPPVDLPIQQVESPPSGVSDSPFNL